MKPTDGISLPFTVGNWHRDTKDALETVGPVFFAASLAWACPPEALLDAEVSQVLSLKSWNSNACYCVDLLLERPFVTKLLPPFSKNLTHTGARSSWSVQPRLNHRDFRKADSHASPDC